MLLRLSVGDWDGIMISYLMIYIIGEHWITRNYPMIPYTTHNAFLR